MQWNVSVTVRTGLVEGHLCQSFVVWGGIHIICPSRGCLGQGKHSHMKQQLITGRSYAFENMTASFWWGSLNMVSLGSEVMGKQD